MLSIIIDFGQSVNSVNTPRSIFCVLYWLLLLCIDLMSLALFYWFWFALFYHCPLYMYVPVQCQGTCYSLDVVCCYIHFTCSFFIYWFVHTSCHSDFLLYICHFRAFYSLLSYMYLRDVGFVYFRRHYAEYTWLNSTEYLVCWDFNFVFVADLLFWQSYHIS